MFTTVPSKIYSIVFTTPLGPVLAEASDKGLKTLHFIKDANTIKEHLYSNHPVLLQTKKEISEYFSGKRTKFDIPLDWAGASDFYKSVWKVLLTIPFGQTNSYGGIAKKLGDINKSRAIGLANGRNPIAIVVPCHRVIGSDGSLTGYAGGIENKLKLLQLENPGKWVKQQMLF